MNQTSFEVGDRVRHKVTQIEGEVVQTEKSLAMPHVWVIEPSEREVNPHKLYRLIDLEKVEIEDEGAQKTNQAQDVNPNISRANQSAEADSSSLKEFQGESVLTVEEDTTAQLSGETTQGSNKRRKREGTGRIQSRTITKKNGKLLSAILVRLASTYQRKNNLQKCLHSKKDYLKRFKF